MFSIDGFNNLNRVLKWLLGSIIILSPFWYLVIYFIRPNLVLATRIDIPLISTFCLTICTFISLWPLTFFLLLYHAVFINKIHNPDDIDYEKKEKHIKKDIWQDIDVLFIFNILFSIFLSFLSLYFIKKNEVESFQELISFILEIILYTISLSFLLNGQLAFRGGCLSAMINTIISITLFISTYFIFN